MACSLEKSQNGYYILPKGIYAFEDKNNLIFCFSDKEKNIAIKTGKNPLTGELLEGGKWMSPLHENASELEFTIISEGERLYKGSNKLGDDILPPNGIASWFAKEAHVAYEFACGTIIMKSEGYLYEYSLNKDVVLMNLNSKSNINYMLKNSDKSLHDALKSVLQIAKKDDLSDTYHWSGGYLRPEYRLELNSENLERNDTVFLRCINFPADNIIMNWACKRGYDGFYSSPDLLYCQKHHAYMYMRDGFFIEEIILCNSRSDIEFVELLEKRECEETPTYTTEELLNLVIEGNREPVVLESLRVQKGLTGKDITENIIRKTKRVDILRMYENVFGVPKEKIGDNISKDLIQKLIKTGNIQELEELHNDYGINIDIIDEAISLPMLQYLRENFDLTKKDINIYAYATMIGSDETGDITKEIINGYKISQETMRKIMKKIIGYPSHVKYTKGLIELNKHLKSPIDYDLNSVVIMSVLSNSTPLLKFLREEMGATLQDLNPIGRRDMFIEYYIRAEKKKKEKWKEMRHWVTENDVREYNARHDGEDDDDW